MKYKLELLLLASVLAVAPILAGDSAPKIPSPVQQKIREIDLSILLKQYEIVKTKQAEVRLDLALLSVNSAGNADAQKRRKETLEKTDEVLTQLADQYRATAFEFEATH